MRGTTMVLAFILALTAGVWVVATGTADQAKPPANAAAPEPSFSELQAGVGATFKGSCAVSGCHTGKRPEARLPLDPQGLPGSLKNVQSREVRTLKLVDTANPARSYLVMKLRGDKGIKGQRMPRVGAFLKEPQMKIIVQWIDGLAAADSAAAGKGAAKRIPQAR